MRVNAGEGRGVGARQGRAGGGCVRFFDAIEPVGGQEGVEGQGGVCVGTIRGGRREQWGGTGGVRGGDGHKGLYKEPLRPCASATLRPGPCSPPPCRMSTP